MKKFTCKEMGGVCDAVFEGEDAKQVGKAGGDHIRSSTDEAHRAMREQMAQASPEDQAKWWQWFEGEWDKKEAA